MSARRRVHVLVSGRVQGVWFRGSTQDRALALAVDGWARNLADGRVEIEAEGTPEAIDAFVGWCHEGPRGARVDTVEVVERDPAGGPAGFRVRRD